MTNQLLIDKWKELARDDLKLCEIALRESLFLQAAFHAQQSIEKTLKAQIILHKNTNPPYTHDLVILIDELKDYIKIDINFRQTLSTINPYYIKSRYPSYKEDLLKNTNQKDAIEFVKIAKEVFSWFEQNKK